MALVLDCSALARWWIPGKEPSWSPGQIGATILAPAFLQIEWANTLLKLMRFRGLSAETAASYRLRLKESGLTWVTDAGLLEGAWWLIHESTLSVYDALYVQLARTEGVPLATADRRMSVAASALGIPVAWAGGTSG